MIIGDKLLREKLVVIARGITLKKLVRCCEVLLEVGVDCVETTFDHKLSDPISDNVQKIRAIRAAFGDKIRVGVGTTLNVQEVQAAFDAGAEYVISPSTKPSVIHETKRLGMFSIPGAMTPTEISIAWDEGADIVKLFPADDLGFHYIENLKGPLPHIPLMATGGVNLDTITRFLSSGIDVVGTGISILKKDLLAAEDYGAIRDLAAKHREAILLWKEENCQ